MARKELIFCVILNLSSSLTKKLPNSDKSNLPTTKELQPSIEFSCLAVCSNNFEYRVLTFYERPMLYAHCTVFIFKVYIISSHLLHILLSDVSKCQHSNLSEFYKQTNKQTFDPPFFFGYSVAPVLPYYCKSTVFSAWYTKNAPLFSFFTPCLGTVFFS
uniref:Uncharacterized protein n=1 Tax=Cacopsylla melanoneura TaxID=428564 RepID=A0A8D8XTT5_9HEMI